MTGLNNPVSIRKALFPKHFWPPWQQKRNCLCNWNLTPEDDNSTKESLFPLTFVWKTEGCVYQWSGTKIGITYFFTWFICAIHFEIKVWYLKDLVKKSSLLQNWGPDRIKRRWWLNTWESSAQVSHLVPVVFLAFCGCLRLKTSRAHSSLNTCPQLFWVCTNNAIKAEMLKARSLGWEF